MKCKDINDLFSLWDDPAETLFMYFLQNSYVLEDSIEQLIKEAYKNNIRCTQITQAYCQKHGLFDNLDYDDVIQTISEKEKATITNKCKNEIKQYVSTNKQFFEKTYECISDWYRIIIQEMNEQDEIDISDVHQLDDIEDKKGDTYTTGKGFTIDEPVRDYPFVIYDGIWFNWNNELNCNSHQAVIDACFGEGKARSMNVRDIENIKDVDPTKPVIFGDSIGDIGFIEACQNISVEDAAKICKKKFHKVYQYQQMENLVKRLAKKG